MPGAGDFNHNDAVNHAMQYSGGGSDSNMFSQAMSFVNQNKSHLQNQDIDHSQMIGAHQALYGDGQGGNQQHSANTLGAGAAMNALKVCFQTMEHSHNLC